MISVSKGLQGAVNLLSLFGQVDLHQRLSHRHVNWILKKLEATHVATENALAEIIVRLGEQGSNGSSTHNFFQTRKILGGSVTFLAFGDNNGRLARDGHRVLV